MLRKKYKSLGAAYISTYPHIALAYKFIIYADTERTSKTWSFRIIKYKL